MPGFIPWSSQLIGQSMGGGTIFDTLTEEIKTLSLMNVPTLMVWGREEKAIALPIGQKMHRILKGSRLEILDEAGHCAHDDQPDRFNQLTLEFLASHFNAS